MRPFNTYEGSEYFAKIIQEIKESIQKLDNEYVLKSNREDLYEFFLMKGVIEEVKLYPEDYYIKNKKSSTIQSYDSFSKTPYNAQGTLLEIAIPFTGNKVGFQISASTLSLGRYPDIDITDNELIINIKYLDTITDSKRIRQEIDSSIRDITKGIEYFNNDVQKHNIEVKKSIESNLNSKISTALKSSEIIEQLGIPIKRKSIPDIYVADIKRKIRISEDSSLPKVSTEEFALTPVLDSREYNHILGILSSMSKVIESNPIAFSTLNEEAIRTHFLLHLNGHYEGQATGETFNKIGKTDIIIKVKDRNIFIAECKFWKGDKSFNDAIDQLLGYLTWRDCKCALIIFNKNKDSLAVANKMHEIMMSRVECKKNITLDIKGNSTYIFSKQDEPRNTILITTQIYDIPS